MVIPLGKVVIVVTAAIGNPMTDSYPLPSTGLTALNDGTHSKEFDVVNFSTFGTWLNTVIIFSFCTFSFLCFLVGWRRQQAGDALVQLEQEGHAFGVGGVGLFAAAGLVGGVYGCV